MLLHKLQMHVLLQQVDCLTVPQGLQVMDSDLPKTLGIK